MLRPSAGHEGGGVGRVVEPSCLCLDESKEASASLVSSAHRSGVVRGVLWGMGSIGLDCSFTAAFSS